MCPCTYSNPIFNIFQNFELPNEPEIVPPYFCHHGSGYSHTTIPAIICTACLANLIYEKSDEWSLIRFHQLSIRKPILIICNRCHKNLHAPREGYHCRTCTNKFIEYLTEYGNPRLREGDNAILIESEIITKTELQ